MLYPKKAVIGSDTVCIISTEQVKQLNKVFVDRDECNEIKDSLGSMIKNYDKLVETQSQAIESQKTEIEIQKKIVAEKNNIIEADEKIIKKSERKIKWLIVQRNALGLLSIVLIAFTIINI